MRSRHTANDATFRHPCGWLLRSLVCAQIFVIAGIGHADDEDVLQKYLQRLGLHDLRMQQLEGMVQLKRSGQQQRQDTVKELADLYVSQLLAAADDDSRRNLLVSRVNSLLKNHPTAKTPALEVMLLQADYAAAESAAEKWLEDPSTSGTFQSAKTTLTKIAPELDLHLAKLDKEIERLSKQLENATKERQIEELEEELGQSQQVAGRARFYSAWTQYYLGALQETQAGGQELFAKSRETFRKFLSIENAYGELSAEELGLASPAMSRAMIGLAFAEIGSGDSAAGQQCLNLLQNSDAPLELRSQTEFWQLQGLINAKMIPAATVVATTVLAAESKANEASQLSVSVRAAVAGLARSKLSESAVELGLVGVAGLTRLRRFQIARQLLEKYGVALDDATGFYLLWISGQQSLAGAEKSGQTALYQQASDRFSQALQTPEAKADQPSASQCRYELAFCQFKLGKYFESAESYASMISELTTIDKSMAANAAWMAFAGYQKSLQQHPEGRRKAIKVLERLKRDFPESPHAEKVDYQLSLLQRESKSPEAAMAELEAISSESDAYVDSRYDLCLLIHKQFNGAAADERAKLAPRLLQNVNVFLSASDPASDEKRRLKCLVIAADVALNGPDADESAAGKYLQQAAALTANSDKADAVMAEFHYRMLQFAIEKGNAARVVKHADWLTKNAPGSPYELPALVELAQRLGSDDAQPADGYNIYRRLVEIFGDDVETIKANKNARIASFNLAKYAAATGKFAEASEAIQRVLQTDPKNKRYLTLAAESDFQSGQYDRAVDHYRTLVRGLKANTDEWYEAKYFQIASLMKSDAQKGMQVLKQFQLMHRELKAPWEAKFQQLRGQE